MAELKKRLVAEERLIFYETKLMKIQKTIKKFELFIFMFFVIFTYATFPDSPVIVGSFSFFVAFILKLNNLMVIDIKKDIEKIGLHFEKDKPYFIHIGNAVTAIEDVPKPPNVLNIKKSRLDGFNPEALQYPIIVEDTQMLTHMFVIGTTGAGKTTFLVNILEQVLMLGGGNMTVDGKGDQSVYENFYNTAIACGREDDFFVINYLKPDQSNTVNFLQKGTADEINDIIGNMLDTSGDNAFWAGRAGSMMKGLLSVLVTLKDNGLLFTPEGEKAEILTFTLIQKWIADVNLKKLYFTVKVANKIVNGTYRYFETEDGSKKIRFEEEPLQYMHGTNSNELEDMDEKYEFYEEEKDNLRLPFTKDDFEKYKNLYYEKNEKLHKGIDLDRLESYLTSVYFNIEDEFAEITESSSKQHGNSFLMWNESLDLIAGRFGKIFDTKFPEIDMQDIVSNGRILYILLPSLKVDPRTLSVLGKIILGFFKQSVSVLLGDKISGTVEERYRSFAIRPRIPFWAVMDEYGAYAVEGFDNVLAQARSLRVSVAILVQEIASLKKANELEAQRLLGNTGIKVILKVEEQKSIEEVIEFVGDDDFAFVNNSRVNETIEERSIQIERRKILTTAMLKRMKGGHAYIVWEGKVVPALVRFYEPPIAKNIPEFGEFKRNITQKYFRERFIKDYLDNTENNNNTSYYKKYKTQFSNNKKKEIDNSNNFWGE